MRFCAFCGTPEDKCKELFSGLHGEILCGDCVRAMEQDLRNPGSVPAADAASGEKPAEKPLPKPKEIYELLERDNRKSIKLLYPKYSISWVLPTANAGITRFPPASRVS